MKINRDLDLGVKALDARRHGREWVARASGGEGAVCPGCGSLSRSRKGRYCRILQDLPMQGSPVTLSLELSRWRCRNLRCPRESFVEPLPNVAPSHARRTHRVAELARLIGYSAGARPAEKILRQLGMPQSDDTVLRDLRKSAVIRPVKDPRVVGVARQHGWPVLLPHPKMLPRIVRLSRKVVPAPSTAFPSLVPLQELRQPTTSRIPSGAPSPAAIPLAAAAAFEAGRSHKHLGAPSEGGQIVLPTFAMAQLQTKHEGRRPRVRTDPGYYAFSSSLAPSAEPSVELRLPSMLSVNWRGTVQASVARSRA